jgi:hypothetical protein
VLLGTAAIGIVELVIVGHRGHLFGVAFAVAAAVGALVVRRRDLPAAMIAPPLLYCVLIGVFSLIDTTDTTGSFLSRRTTYLAIGFVTGAPALWIGTAAAVAIGWYRLRVRRT